MHERDSRTGNKVVTFMSRNGSDIKLSYCCSGIKLHPCFPFDGPKPVLFPNQEIIIKAWISKTVEWMLSF